VLTLTPTAVEAVRRISVASGFEPEPGLRIFADEQTDGRTTLALEVTGGPAADDRTVEDEGATVYVDDALGDFLDEKVLDAAFEGEQVRFSLLEAPGDGAPPAP
jgi:Fe-S cluster assembly iron-binding protein IscA